MVVGAFVIAIVPLGDSVTRTAPLPPLRFSPPVEEIAVAACVVVVTGTAPSVVAMAVAPSVLAETAVATPVVAVTAPAVEVGCETGRAAAVGAATLAERSARVGAAVPATEVGCDALAAVARSTLTAGVVETPRLPAGAVAGVVPAETVAGVAPMAASSFTTAPAGLRTVPVTVDLTEDVEAGAWTATA